HGLSRPWQPGRGRDRAHAPRLAPRRSVLAAARRWSGADAADRLCRVRRPRAGGCGPAQTAPTAARAPAARVGRFRSKGRSVRPAPRAQARGAGRAAGQDLPRARRGEPLTFPTVEARQVAKVYGRQRALAGVDLTLRAGEAAALLGPNGAGK